MEWVSGLEMAIEHIRNAARRAARRFEGDSWDCEIAAGHILAVVEKACREALEAKSSRTGYPPLEPEPCTAHGEPYCDCDK